MSKMTDKTDKKNTKASKTVSTVKASKTVKPVKDVTRKVRKSRKSRKVNLSEVTDVIDQIIHRNQMPEHMSIMIPKKRGPKVKVRRRKGEAGPAHPIKSHFGDPVGVLVARRVDYDVNGKVITKAELEAATANGNETMVLDHSKVFIGATRCNVNSGDEFNAAIGRALAMEQIERMVAGETVTIAESLVPYLRPFRERCQRYFTKPYAREMIEVVTPSARGREGFAEKVSYAMKQVQLRQREAERVNEAKAVAEKDPVAQAKREARAKKRAELEADGVSSS